ncbi:MAG: hypothetical protein ACR2FM_04465 [Candidatus Saccharimonadales bacterium]
MKQKDIALIIIVIFIGGVFSVIMTKTVFVSKGSKQQTAEKVEAISSEFKIPDKEVFNPNAINPTKLIRIGDESNTSPF